MVSQMAPDVRTWDDGSQGEAHRRQGVVTMQRSHARENRATQSAVFCGRQWVETESTPI